MGKIEEKTRKERVKNETFRVQLVVKAIEETIRARQLGWLSLLYKMPDD